GNEPSHHIPYLYNWTDSPWRAQDKIRMILNRMYQTGADGLGGNDDFGQMSAWYIFSSLGFYPVAPGSAHYSLGSPSIKSAKVRLSSGKTFEVLAKNQSEKNVYVTKVELNGRELKSPVISHEDILKGGKLIFHMSATPNTNIYK